MELTPYLKKEKRMTALMLAIVMFFSVTATAFGAGIGATILEMGTMAPLPSNSFPNTYVSLWRLADNPYDGTTDEVQNFMNGTWSIGNQGVVAPNGVMGMFTTDWNGVPLPASGDYTLVVQIGAEKGFKTAYRTGVSFNGVGDTNLGTILVERSPLEIYDMNAYFSPGMRKSSLLVIIHRVENHGAKKLKIFPYAVVSIPGDMEYTIVPVGADQGEAVNICGGCSISLHYRLLTKKIIPGFEVGGQVVITGDDPISTLGVGYFTTHTK